MSAAIDIRKCRVCADSKRIEEFAIDRRKPLGRSYECRECKRCRDKVRDSRPARKVKQALLQRERVHTHREQQAATRARTRRAKGWPRRESDPIKAAARRALAYEVRSGRIEKPSRCEDCGQQKEPRRLHGHHEDYTKPLDVVWLCPPCHMARHRKYPDTLTAAQQQEKK